MPGVLYIPYKHILKDGGHLCNILIGGRILCYVFFKNIKLSLKKRGQPEEP